MIANRSALAWVSLINNRKAAFSLRLGLCVLALSLCALAQQGTITSFDPPGSLQTEPLSINSAGAVTGYYSDGSALHGFLREPDGSFTSFDPPGATATEPASINSAGSIAGSFVAGQFHGFLRDPEGDFTTFDPPGSTSTMATSLNSASAIAGYYTLADHSFHACGFDFPLCQEYQLGGSDYGLLPRLRSAVSRLRAGCGRCHYYIPSSGRAELSAPEH